MRLNIAFGNLMFNIDQQHDLHSINTKQYRQFTYSHDILVLLCIYCWRGEVVTCSFCVSIALYNQHAKRNCFIILRPVPCLVVPYFFTLSHKRQNFQKTKYLNKNYLSWFCMQLDSEKLLFLRKIRRNIVLYKVVCLYVKYTLSLSEFSKHEVSLQFFVKFENISFYENSFNGSGVIWCGWTDGRTVITNLQLTIRKCAGEVSAIVLKSSLEFKYWNCLIWSGERLHILFKETLPNSAIS